ncbi:hypothetical protein [Heliophilum fasciatum]|uniref:Uncharacterized protein n=1 Tax=Heliophilum fasciatum TaxID=35700 RepID=A0A4R2RII2_9FIRM|nr:hypothetical protein [Heliophilum fasciatum]MCW2278743.1 hypothetical protein [Heliophilum fasciatum]TCP62518.1 hypothetical protein EDD73_12116 [Heliophilum fasciatum]
MARVAGGNQRGQVPGLTPGLDLSTAALQVRQSLTTDLPTSPKLNYFSLIVEGTSRPGIATVGSRLLVLPKDSNLPGVTAKVKTSTDGVNYTGWQEVALGEPVTVPYPGFFKLAHYGGGIRYKNTKKILDETINLCGEVVISQ